MTPDTHTEQPNTPSMTTMPGNQLELAVGERLSVEQLESGNRFWVEVSGRVEHKLIITTSPFVTKLKQRLISDSVVTIRGRLDDGVVCGFRTSVAKVLEVPCPLLFLHYPIRFERISLRQNNRFGCYTPVNLMYDGTEYPGVITNISLSGAQIVLDAKNVAHLPRFSTNAEVFLLFTLCTTEEEIIIKSLVRSITAKSGRILIGVMFLELIAETQTAISEYIAEMENYSTLY